MYTIKEAAARTGLSIPVLRAWERRYGVVAPTRTPGGYRVYDEAAIGRLRAMRRLIDAGWSASTAAAAVVAGDAGPASLVIDTQSAAAFDPALTERLVDAAAALDSPEVERVLDDMFATGSFERVMDAQVVPGLRALGDAWASGRVTVAGEHLASNAVQRRLAAAFQASAVGDDAQPPILVGMPAGARHELGGLMFATAARRAGLPVAYLGADLPVAEWLAAVARTRAPAVVIGALLERDADSALEIGRELRKQNPELVIAYGGRAAPDPDGTPRTIRLPTEVRDAVAALRSALRA